jgi:hypothetical protein
MTLNATTELISELTKANNVFLLVDKAFLNAIRVSNNPVLDQLHQNSELKVTFHKELIGPFILRGTYVEVRELNHIMVQAVLNKNPISST